MNEEEPEWHGIGIVGTSWLGPEVVVLHSTGLTLICKYSLAVTFVSQYTCLDSDSYI